MKAAGTAARDRATVAALGKLRSPDFFSQLRHDLRCVGFLGKDELIGLGVYFVAVSRFRQQLRAQILEQTEGTAAHFVRTLKDFFPPDDVVKVTPTGLNGWTRFSQAPDGKLLFIQNWERQTEVGVTQLDVEPDQLVRRTPIKEGGRVVTQVAEVPGRFACISTKRPWPRSSDLRWLTMTQPDRQQVANGIPSAAAAGPPDFEVWRKLQQLLQERAQIPVVLPEWEHVIWELAFKRDDRALRQVPTLLQMWRTMTLIRSFQDPGNDTACSLRGTFEDLAATLLFGRKVFREACWFPSSQKIYDKLSKSEDRTSVINPATGKAHLYQRLVPKVERPYQDPLYWNREKEAGRGT